MDISSAQSVLKKLEETQTVSYPDIISGRVPVPKVAGVYAWWFKDTSKSIVSIWYVGESKNLHDQIIEDCTSLDNSPMRQKLQEHMLKNRHNYDEKSDSQDVNEKRLNDMMEYQALVSWVEESEHKEVVEYIIKNNPPDFNR